jgi:hypothetical protein
MKKILFLLNFVLCVSFMSAQVFITEIHYDNAGGDIGEGVEISGPATINLSTWSIILYNGSNGTSYNTTTLSGTIPDEGAGFGAVFFPISGMQNGAPDGVALLNGSVVVEFLSYEGSFTATDGSANGITSTDIGVSETSSTPTGESLFLTDSGWMGPSVATPGTLNPGLSFGGPPVPTILVSPSNIIGLDYVFGAGPSGIDSAIISGSNLTGAVTLSAIVNFEFSLDKTTWTAFPGAISGPAINVTPIKVYTRLKAPVIPLLVNTYIETLTLSSVGAADFDFTFSGEVIAPVVVCTPTLQTLPYIGIAGTAGFDHATSNAPPAAPAEVCGTNFLLSYTTLPGTDGSDNEFGNMSNLGLSGLSSADFGGEASFETYPIDVSGVTAVTIDAIGNTAGGSVFNGTSEQFEWWYTLDGGTQVPFFTTTSDGSLAANVSPLDVTSVDEIIVGFTFNVNGSGDGFEDVDVTIIEFNPSAPLITVDTILMDGFTYVAGSGPSTTQTNTLEWSNLTGSVTSANVVNFFEFSIDAGATWNDASSLNVSIPPFPGTAPSFIVLVRLVSGLTLGTYSDTLVLSSTGALTVEVYLEGTVTPAPLPSCADLFFSEYIEGSSSNKCLEIYNPTASDIDLAAGNYSLALYNNGATSSTGGSFALEGIVPAYGTYVVCNASASASFLALADTLFGGFPNPINFNGDDAVSLEKGGINIDIIGQIGVDPGSSWTNGGVATSEFTLLRNTDVGVGDNVGSDAFDPSAEWTALPQDDLSNLGQHNSDCAPFVWTGVSSTDYHTGSNWTKGAVPVSSEHAWIPAAPLGGVFPIANQDVDLMDLTVRSAASLNVKPTFGLILFGTATNNGTVTLESSALGTAWLDDFTTSTATYTGDISVQTFVTTGSGLGQRYFGSPVVSGAVQGLDGTYTGYPLGQIIPLATCDPNQLDLASPYSNLFEWNENNSFPTSCVQEGWNAISAATNLTPGRSYSGWVNDGSVISLTGAPNTGNTIFATSGVSPSSASISNANGWHLLANPFPSPLDVNSVFTSGFVSPQTYDGGSGPFSGTFNPILVSGNNIAVMQGFVARSSGGSTFTASQSDRVAGNEVWLRPEFTHMLEVSVLGNNMADRTYVYFDSEATDDFDSIADCDKKESNFGHPTLYTNLDGQRLSLNGYAIDNMNRSVGLGLLPGSNGVFTLDFEGIASFPSTSLIYLEDKLTGDFVNLREQTTYSFAANTAEASNRFEIHFTAPITVSSIDASCEGGDAEIVIDFGMHQVNNSSIEWDYMLEANNSAITNGTQVNGLVTVDEIQEGVYTLVLNQGLYNVNVPVTVSGASTVYADFENPTAIEVGNTINLANFSSGGIDYLWLVEGQSFLAPSFTHTFNNAGTFNIVLEASNEDCEAVKTKTIQVNAKVTGIRDAGDLALTNVYTQNSTIVVDLSKLRLPNTSSLEIYNLLGQSIYSGKVGNTVVRIDTKNTSAYYFVTVRNKELQKVFKVLVK